MTSNANCRPTSALSASSTSSCALNSPSISSLTSLLPLASENRSCGPLQKQSSTSYFPVSQTPLSPIETSAALPPAQVPSLSFHHPPPPPQFLPPASSHSAVVSNSNSVSLCRTSSLLAFWPDGSESSQSENSEESTHPAGRSPNGLKLRSTYDFPASGRLKQKIFESTTPITTASTATAVAPEAASIGVAQSLLLAGLERTASSTIIDTQINESASRRHARRPHRQTHSAESSPTKVLASFLQVPEAGGGVMTRRMSERQLRRSLTSTDTSEIRNETISLATQTSKVVAEMASSRDQFSCSGPLRPLPSLPLSRRRIVSFTVLENSDSSDVSSESSFSPSLSLSSSLPSPSPSSNSIDSTSDAPLGKFTRGRIRKTILPERAEQTDQNPPVLSAASPSLTHVSPSISASSAGTLEPQETDI
ncbi:unnamed protein product [Protopolystoma xenopodis]|uniref:Uncharacterized protein n=1 Tax=Protopolystoma xenopodis TaxID=117903 RepID=A0A448WW73_9PLAT|nr:unnamed protein product [Protopolystoma xenopodis]